MFMIGCSTSRQSAGAVAPNIPLSQCCETWKSKRKNAENAKIKTPENAGKPAPENAGKSRKTPENAGKRRKMPEKAGKTAKAEAGNRAQENAGKRRKKPEDWSRPLLKASEICNIVRCHDCLEIAVWPRFGSVRFGSGVFPVSPVHGFTVPPVPAVPTFFQFLRFAVHGSSGSEQPGGEGSESKRSGQ